MNYTVEKLEKNQVALQIEVETEQVEKALTVAYTKLVKKVNIPGFRKGRAPRALVERYIGKAALFEEAAEGLITSNYIEAIRQSGIEPIDRPSVEIVQLDEHVPFVFKAVVEVKPEVQLGQYKGIVVEPQDFSVKPDDIEKELTKLQQRVAKLMELDENAEIKAGDVAFIGFQGLLDGVPFEGGTSEGYSLEIGSGTFIPGFEEQLVGAKVNEKREVNVVFPEEYHKEELAGKPVVFNVEIKGIKRKELPVIDDEFAKDVSEFESLDELKSDISKRLEETSEKKKEDYIKNRVITQAVENSTVDVPDLMIQNKIEYMIEDLEYRLEMQGLNLDKYLQYTNSDRDKLTEYYRPQAEYNVKTDLVLETIAKVENIEVTEQDINTELERIGKQYNQQVENIKASIQSSGRMEMLKYGLAMNKTIDFLVSHAELG